MFVRYLAGVLLSCAAAGASVASPLNLSVGELRGIAIGKSCAEVAGAVDSLAKQSTTPSKRLDCSALGGKYAYRTLSLHSEGKTESISVSFTPESSVWRVNSFTRFGNFNRPLRTEVLEALGERFWGAPALVRLRDPWNVHDVAVWSSERSPRDESKVVSYRYQPCPGKPGSSENHECMLPQLKKSGEAWRQAVQELGGLRAEAFVESTTNTPSDRVIAVAVRVSVPGVDAAAAADEVQQLREETKPKLPAY
ncbi:MAG: hypothetical protein HHJ15_13555 [Rhodoferax sp.]|uniref:hypothetical protein n=1 Tax=Rhodoferax sp. TaxID=50421 RepID=UPI0017F06390|nr:hypothetical protein [Rhodoferax sp.]NMM20957.1 hypothetical protein [Rhodoferax sp.]